jgi:membrane-associated phospholipid phosphatase
MITMARKSYCLFAAAVSLGVFACDAVAVARGRAAGFDQAVAAALQRMASPVTDLLMRLFSAAGSFPFVLVVVGVLGLWRLQGADRRGALAVAGFALGSEVLNLALKQLFHRLRPEDFGGLDSFSFPSGHAMAAVSTYGMAAVLLIRSHPDLQIPACMLASVLALLVGASRIFLGFHWASDVLAGFAAGMLLLVIWTRLTASPSLRS